MSSAWAVAVWRRPSAVGIAERRTHVDSDVVGKLGKVVTRIRGGEMPGEVRIPVRGTFETFIAYSDTPIERHETVLVFHSRGNRAVDVAPAPWAAL
jgi:membrane protein implicated in regulation of membrane protease activity